MKARQRVGDRALDFAAVSMPVMAVSAEKDTIAPPAGVDAIKRIVPHAEVVRLGRRARRHRRGPRGRVALEAHRRVLGREVRAGSDIMIFLAWRGQRVCVSETGEGEPLFLVPGLGNNADMWAPFMEQFPNRRLITFDAPGTGRSSTPLFPVSVAVARRARGRRARLARRRPAPTSSASRTAAPSRSNSRTTIPSACRRLVLAATTCGVGAIWGSLAGDGRARDAVPVLFARASSSEPRPRRLRRPPRAMPSRRLRNVDARHRLPPSAYGYAMQLLGGMTWSSWPFLPTHSARDARDQRRRRSAGPGRERRDAREAHPERPARDRRGRGPPVPLGRRGERSRENSALRGLIGSNQGGSHRRRQFVGAALSLLNMSRVIRHSPFGWR